MYHAELVNVTEADQGLLQILRTTLVQQEVIDYLMKVCELQTTSYLLGYVGHATYESELADIIKKRFPEKAAEGEGSPGFPVEKQRLYITKLRAAFKMALEVQDRVTKAKEKPDTPEEAGADIERPLDSKAVEALEAAWKAKHDFQFVPKFRPAPPFKARIYRELHQKCGKLVQVEKVRTVDDNRTSQDPQQLPIGGVQPDGGRLLFEVERKQSRTIRNVLDYLTAVSIIMRTYAFCGTHKVPAHGATLLREPDTPKEVTFFSFGAALQYIDDLTGSVLAIDLPDHAKLSWLRKRDETIRTEMVALINEGVPGDEALFIASNKYKHLWIMKDTHEAIHEAGTLAIWEAPPQGLKRPRDDRGGKGKDKGKKGHGKGKDQDNRMTTVTMLPGGKVKVCGAFNSARGCTKETQCPQRGRHVCSVKMRDGTICQARDHGAATHHLVVYG